MKECFPGQVKLQQSSVAVVGAGGLGCPALQYLAAAGVGKYSMSRRGNIEQAFLGHIAIIDHDTVELSNLQRQILHEEQSIGKHKAFSAAAAVQRWIAVHSPTFLIASIITGSTLGCGSLQ